MIYEEEKTVCSSCSNCYSHICINCASACGSLQLPKTINIANKVDLRLETIAKEQFSGNVEEGNYIIKDSVRWKDLWLKTYENTIPVPEIPQIDFTKYTVIAIYIGKRNTGGYKIEITELVETGNNLLIKATETTPGSGCSVPMAISSPFHMIKIPRTDKEMGFEITEKADRC